MGLYFRCSGLNSDRFAGKGVSSEAWGAVFAYYCDLTLLLLALETGHDLNPQSTGEVAAQELSELFYPRIDHWDSLDAAIIGIRRELQHLDSEINNAPLTRTLRINIRSNPGDPLFKGCEILSSRVTELAGVDFVFLVDEFENLSGAQQVYFNTLVRERLNPVTFVVGSRRHGIKSLATLAGGELNRAGSEFDEVVLEDDYREHESAYIDFCRKLINRRLKHAAIEPPVRLEDLFGTKSIDPHGSTRALEVLNHTDPDMRPWRTQLRQRLADSGAPDDYITAAVSHLSIDDHPVLEKFAILQLYRAWAKSGIPPLLDVREIARATRSILNGQGPYLNSFRHYRDDLLSQIYSAKRLPPDYTGLDTLIRLSGYVPRNLLIVLKKIDKWARFLGEDYGGTVPISHRAQTQGVLEASEWYLSDSKALGEIGESSQSAVRRLGSFLRAIHLSDKPVEVSPVTVALRRDEMTSEALSVVDACVSHGQLIEIKTGHHTKNQENLLFKYQLNPMLSPMFSLPTARRGVISLSTAEADSLFDPGAGDDDVRAAMRKRLDELNAPFLRPPGTVPLW